MAETTGEITAEHQEFLDVYTAARRGDKKEMEELKAGGADIDIRFTNGNTPLMWAARMGLKDAVNMLLENGADLEAKNNFGSTALSESAEQGREDVVTALIDAGATRTTQDQMRNTPLMLAARNGMAEAAAAIVAQRKVQGADGLEDEPMMDLEQKDTEGYTALMWAVLSGHIKVVRLLTGKGASIEETNNNGVSVFAMAARMGQDAILKVLLEKVVSGGMTAEEADANIKRANSLLSTPDRKGNTALMWAVNAASGSTADGGELPAVQAKECCRIILDGQAKEGGLATIDSQNADGDTALIWAAAGGFAEIATYLLEKGASRTIKNVMNLTAAEMAKELGMTACEEICQPEVLPRRGRASTLSFAE
jgi:ankyrin repeat protein|eukprot:COSAG02_NODE_10740_length_1868_cov_28.036744_1_plen_367_part_00